jgi:hypothetical protein
MRKLKPMSGNCPKCGNKLSFKNSEEDKEKNEINVYVCQNENCTDQNEYTSFSK